MLRVVQVQVPLVVPAKIAAVRCNTHAMGGPLLAWGYTEATSCMEVLDQAEQTAPPSCMDSWLIREVRCITRMCQGCSPLGCNSSAFVGMGCVLYHAARLQVICGITGGNYKPTQHMKEGTALCLPS